MLLRLKDLRQGDDRGLIRFAKPMAAAHVHEPGGCGARGSQTGCCSPLAQICRSVSNSISWVRGSSQPFRR